MTNIKLFTTILLILVLPNPITVSSAPVSISVQKLRISLSQNDFKQATLYLQNKIPDIKNGLKSKLNQSLTQKKAKDITAAQMVHSNGYKMGGVLDSDSENISNDSEGDDESSYEDESSDEDDGCDEADDFSRDNGFISQSNPATILRFGAGEGTWPRW